MPNFKTDLKMNFDLKFYSLHVFIIQSKFYCQLISGLHYGGPHDKFSDICICNADIIFSTAFLALHIKAFQQNL